MTNSAMKENPLANWIFRTINLKSINELADENKFEKLN